MEGGHNLTPLVDIGLTDLPKFGEVWALPAGIPPYMATFMLPVLASPPSALHESTGTSDEVNLIFFAACQIAGKF